MASLIRRARGQTTSASLSCVDTALRCSDCTIVQPGLDMLGHRANV